MLLIVLLTAAAIATASAAFAVLLIEGFPQPGRAWLIRWLRRLGAFALFCWFLYWGWGAVHGNFLQGHQEALGIDGRLYYRAAAAWLAGGNPWGPEAATYTNAWPSGCCVQWLFTGPPPTVLAFAPLTLIPEDLFVRAWMALTLAAAFYTLRRLGLPWWWIMFPPLAQGITVGNPHVVCLAVLVAGSDHVRWLAVPLKAYAVAPLVGEQRWRALVGVGVAVGLSVVLFWPLWSSYLSQYGEINRWIGDATHGGFSAHRDPRLFAVTLAAVAALAVLDWRAAGWLAVPALFPAGQFFYASFALPLRSPWLAFALATAGHRADAAVPWIICGYAGLRVAGWGLARGRRARRGPVAQHADVVGDGPGSPDHAVLDLPVVGAAGCDHAGVDGLVARHGPVDRRDLRHATGGNGVVVTGDVVAGVGR